MATFSSITAVMQGHRRIFLTGASGFVGRQILRALKEQQAWVRAAVREGTTLSGADEVIVTQDLFAEPGQWWSKALKDIDIVIHAAWYVEPGKYLTSPINHYCLIGSLRLADAFLKSDAQHFVGIGSCFEYDTSLGILDIHTPLRPSHPYTIAKVSLYQALQQVLPAWEKTFSWHRLFYLYGEGEKPGRLVSNLRRHLQEGRSVDLTSGTHVRDFLDVSLAGDAIAKAALAGVTGPYNIASGQGRSIREIAEDIADEYGRRDLLRFGVRQENPIDPPVIIGVPGNKRRPHRP